jgi:hypothetical protein
MLKLSKLIEILQGFIENGTNPNAPVSVYERGGDFTILTQDDIVILGTSDNPNPSVEEMEDIICLNVSILDEEIMEQIEKMEEPLDEEPE